jgi:hypothetical protein
MPNKEHQAAHAAIWMKLLPALIPLIIGLILFSSMLDDDSYITYWAAYILAETGEMVNYNGARVEQSSSLAFVLLLAILAKLLPLTIPSIGPIVSCGFGMATVLMTQRLASAVNPAFSLCAGLLTGSATCLIVWSFAGMETTFQAFLALCLLLAYVRFLTSDLSAAVVLSTGITTFLYLIVRPESVFVILSLLLGMITLLCFMLKSAESEKHHQTLTAIRRTGLLLLVAVLAFICIMSFRLVYFGDWFPQPVAAKVAGVSISRTISGLKYMIRHAWTRWDSAIWVLAILGMGVTLLRSFGDTRLHPARMLTGLFMASYTTFIVVSGGDWMIGGRFLVSVLPMTVIMALTVFQRVKYSTVLRPFVAVLVCMQLFATLSFARHESPGGPFWATRHLDHTQQGTDPSWFEVMNRHRFHDINMTTRLNHTIQLLRHQNRRRISIMSGQMGMVTYYTTLENYGHVRIIDRYGLATRDFTSCRVTASNPRFSVGLIVTHKFFFDNRRELEDVCGLGNPDIIWDWGTESGQVVDLVEANGYSIVYRQDGYVSNGSRWFPGMPVRANEFIAVRRDLLESDPASTFYHFST